MVTCQNASGHMSKCQCYTNGHMSKCQCYTNGHMSTTYENKKGFIRIYYIIILEYSLFLSLHENYETFSIFKICIV